MTVTQLANELLGLEHNIRLKGREKTIAKGGMGKKTSHM